ncbi:hypothetical protein SeMB42_g07418 [Synchytrium endobioticum]|nr:hypothetical protein SeMB42_g07418 [Synchytrium endobioticum]
MEGFYDFVAEDWKTVTLVNLRNLMTSKIWEFATASEGLASISPAAASNWRRLYNSYMKKCCELGMKQLDRTLPPHASTEVGGTTEAKLTQTLASVNTRGAQALRKATKEWVKTELVASNVRLFINFLTGRILPFMGWVERPLQDLLRYNIVLQHPDGLVVDITMRKRMLQGRRERKQIDKFRYHAEILGLEACGKQAESVLNSAKAAKTNFCVDWKAIASIMADLATGFTDKALAFDREPSESMSQNWAVVSGYIERIPTLAREYLASSTCNHPPTAPHGAAGSSSWTPNSGSCGPHHHHRLP